MSAVRKEPCAACPYRRDVPSGVWAISEYDKLIAYDAPTPYQPTNAFACHATPEFYCHGWAVVHSNRCGENDLLSLRIASSFHGCPIVIPEPFVPLFGSGTEAAEHGKRDTDRPPPEAIAVADRLRRKYERLRK